MKGFLISNVIFAVLVVGASVVHSQSLPDQQDLAEQLRMNQEVLKDFSWKSKFTYLIDGVQKRVGVFTVRHAGDGVVERRQVSGEVDKEKVRRPNGKKLTKKEREAAYAFVLEVRTQLDAYLNPLFSEKAVSTASMTTTDHGLTLRSHDVVTTGDTVQINYSLPDLRATSAEVTTTVGGSPVSLDIEFDTLKYGLTYPARSTTTATWQDFKLEIITENSDYEPPRREGR